MYRVMIRSYEGWQLRGAWGRREVWSTFTQLDSHADAVSEADSLRAGGNAVTVIPEESYVLFCAQRTIC